MEFLEDYDCTINYHPRKANVEVATLNRKVQILELMIKEWHMIEEVNKWNPRIERQKVICENIQVKSTLLDRLK